MPDSSETPKAFIENYTTPGFLGRINRTILRTCTVGRSIDLDDARDLARRVDLDDKEACRIAGLPMRMIPGLRPSAVAEGLAWTPKQGHMCW